MDKGTSRGKVVAVLVLVLLLCSTGLYFLVADREKPRISLAPDEEYLNGEASLDVRVGDSTAGVARVRVAIVQDGEERTILEAEPEGSPNEWSESFPVGGIELEEGPFRLVVAAGDSSWARFFRGRRTRVEREYVLDTISPRVNLESFRHNLQRGGSAVVAFRVEEDPERAGISVGESFFPAYRQKSGVFLGFFSYPYSLAAGQDQPMVEVRDRAGNVAETSIPCHVRDRRLPRNRIRLSDGFLSRKMPSFRDAFPDIRDNSALFVAVNEKMRRENRERLRTMGRETAPRPLWSGRFLRQRGAKQSSFGVYREYYYQSEKISQSTHPGIDLASVSRAKIPAANSGRVVYADWLGIYGQTVIVDHGLGLQSLYGHLSQIAVRDGQRVDKGEILGRTGTTGLAGGDHLHFEITISGMPVTPVEWWDGSWIENNVLPKLRKAGEKKTD
jgi:murein DD-endopeptidase MepM/ murein hydrolase activator NlpD